MMTTRTSSMVAALFAALTGVYVGACSDPPTRPSPPPPRAGDPATILRLEILGPRSVAPGTQVQFTAVAHRSDGSTPNVTIAASWRSTVPSFVTVSTTGLATANQLARGEAYLEASYEGMTATTEVIVVPAGTYRVLGRVTDIGLTADIGVPGARIEVIGSSPGQSTTADVDGRYRLYGVGGEVEMRVTRDGYQPHSQRLAITDHLTIDVALRADARRDGGVVEGPYVLTIAASPGCRQSLPEGARERRYTAFLDHFPSSDRLEVLLSGAAFVITGGYGNRFDGRLESGGVSATFRLDPPSVYDFYYGRGGDVVERFEEQYLIVHGSVVTRIADDGIAGMRLTGTLDGEISLWKTNPFPPDPSQARTAQCVARDHQFTLHAAR
jgi:hypothetical protein